MTSHERIIIDPQGASDQQFGQAPADTLRGVTWLALGSSTIGDLALAFQGASSSLHLEFAVATVISFVALAGQYARR